MADHNQFGSSKPTQSGDPQHCAQCEAMLMDALDGTLSAADQAIFDRHLLSCFPCSQMVADAQRGAGWLEMLKSPRPEPPAALLERIFAQTSGADSSARQADGKSTTVRPFLASSNTLLGRPAVAPTSAQGSGNVLPFRSRLAAGFNLRTIGHNLLQPRLAMTAAMAFFSVALTLNLTGIKVSQLHASDLRPSSLKRGLSEANAHVVRYYDNLRVVYELESRVHDLQSSSDSDATSAPAKSVPSDSDSRQQPDQQNPDKKGPNGQAPDKQDKEARPRPKPGTSRREDPGVNLRYVVARVEPGARTSVSDAVPPTTSAFAAFSPCSIRSTFSKTDSQVEVQEVRLV